MPLSDRDEVTLRVAFVFLKFYLILTFAVILLFAAGLVHAL